MKTVFFSLLLVATTFAASAQSAQVKTVMDNYGRFGQGDVPGILATLAADVVWVHPGNPAVISYAGTFNGPAGAGSFFEKVGASTKISVFQPSNFRENGSMVSNDCHIEGVILATGKTYASDVVMNWTFGPDGKVTRWEAVGDVSGLETAFTR